MSGNNSFKTSKRARFTTAPHNKQRAVTITMRGVIPYLTSHGTHEMQFASPKVINNRNVDSVRKFIQESRRIITSKQEYTNAQFRELKMYILGGMQYGEPSFSQLQPPVPPIKIGSIKNTYIYRSMKRGALTPKNGDTISSPRVTSWTLNPRIAAEWRDDAVVLRMKLDAPVQKLFVGRILDDRVDESVLNHVNRNNVPSQGYPFSHRSSTDNNFNPSNVKGGTSNRVQHMFSYPLQSEVIVHPAVFKVTKKTVEKIATESMYGEGRKPKIPNSEVLDVQVAERSPPKNMFYKNK